MNSLDFLFDFAAHLSTSSAMLLSPDDTNSQNATDPSTELPPLPTVPTLPSQTNPSLPCQPNEPFPHAASTTNIARTNANTEAAHDWPPSHHTAFPSFPEPPFTLSSGPPFSHPTNPPYNPLPAATHLRFTTLAPHTTYTTPQPPLIPPTHMLPHHPSQPHQHPSAYAYAYLHACNNDLSLSTLHSHAPQNIPLWGAQHGLSTSRNGPEMFGQQRAGWDGVGGGFGGEEGEEWGFEVSGAGGVATPGTGNGTGDMQIGVGVERGVGWLCRSREMGLETDVEGWAGGWEGGREA